MNFKCCSGEALVKSILLYQAVSKKKGAIGFILRKYASFHHKLLSLLTSTDISRDVALFSDLKLPHAIGIVIHGDVSIDRECMIMQLVTIGQLADGAVPKIGRGVYIGSGAKILGKVSIGDFARIGANAVVLDDVPERATAVGVPARVIRHDSG